MEHTTELLSINLSNLAPSPSPSPSPFNVRRRSAGQVEELAALICSQGLLHPLIVTEHVAERKGAQGAVRSGCWRALAPRVAAVVSEHQFARGFGS